MDDEAGAGATSGATGTEDDDGGRFTGENSIGVVFAPPKLAAGGLDETAAGGPESGAGAAKAGGAAAGGNAGGAEGAEVG